MVNQAYTHLFVGITLLSTIIFNLVWHQPFLWTLLVIPAIAIVISYPSWKVAVLTALSFSVLKYGVELVLLKTEWPEGHLPGLVLSTMLNWLVIITLTHFRITKDPLRQQLEQNEQQLRTLINAMPDFVNFKDGEGRWLEVNQFGLELFQLKDTPYKGKKDTELAEYSPFFKEVLLGCEASDEQAWRTKSIVRCEEVIPQPDGPAKIFDVIRVPLFNPDGSRKGLVVIGRDITERKKAAKELTETKERLQLLLDVCPVGIGVTVDDKIVFLNDAGVNLLGGSHPKEIIGKSIYEFVHPDNKRDVKRIRYKVLNEGVTSHQRERKVKRLDGQVIFTEITSTRISYKGKPATLIVANDITERKKSEEWLLKSEKLAVVGELAAGVAHEIRNPLTSLKGFVQLLQSGYGKKEEYYSIMLSELDRINLIVSEFLLLAKKPQALNFQPKNVKGLLDHVITLLNTQAILSNVEILTRSENDIPLIYCEENQLKQVFINILKNAIEAMPDGGQVIVDIQRYDDNHILISVKDQGCGIPEERMAMLGEPFYSTKEKGTGLGLMVSHKIIEVHEGRLEICSKVNEGTTVDIILPVVSKRAGKSLA
ncbi:PAS domain S-box-containing protein [Caldalkalibacillus uzonensis]|uniref:histidine kinase n=1 Tax=Caldalkalibacillus uzonensis TaxID=353224 RepID=A0ABU0CPJ7_9BACI|nr:PAS domain S-box protein [Caldalkalibacillus uzonensis]MDQ0338013.1 PAS domain S-box-containing protein [Caldalkalibacillus uzonensis]